MGRFSLLLLALAACGDNVRPSNIAGENPPDPNGVTTPGTSTTRLVPVVCGHQQWTPTLGSDPTMQIAVAPVAQGAAIVGVRATGGSIGGFAVGERMLMATKASKLDASGMFTQTSLGQIDQQLVLAGVDPTDGFAQFSLLSSDMGTATQILKAPGNVLAQPSAVVDTDGARVAVVGDASGVTAWHFDHQTWQPAASMQVATTEQPTGLTAAGSGDALYVGWSTSSSCHVARLPGFAQPVLATSSAPCREPRLAVDATSNDGVMLFEADDQIHISHIHGTQMGGDSQILRGSAHSPRIAYDGQRYWVAYIEGHGDIAVGFLDGATHSQLVTTTLAGVSPQAHGFELSIVDGAPWIVSVDPADGYSAHELCVASE